MAIIPDGFKVVSEQVVDIPGTVKSGQYIQREGKPDSEYFILATDGSVHTCDQKKAGWDVLAERKDSRLATSIVEGLQQASRDHRERREREEREKAQAELEKAQADFNERWGANAQ